VSEQVCQQAASNDVSGQLGWQAEPGSLLAASSEFWDSQWPLVH